jgi:SpoVK/Ycf46/Vps4 family AAA+-type ATPase
VEVQRADLVAGYVGQTAIQVQSVVRNALGGVLFIDEAYALTSGHGNDFGSEAVATLVKEMEDHREELAVIVAGYTDEMSNFIAMNSGLRSRFQRFIEFPDYPDEDLIEIFKGLANQHGIGVSIEVEDALRSFISNSPANIRIGNGRFVRNLFEEMYARMAVRVSADGVITDDELEEFHADDVPVVEAMTQYAGFGFGRSAQV